MYQLARSIYYAAWLFIAVSLFFGGPAIRPTLAADSPDSAETADRLPTLLDGLTTQATLTSEVIGTVKGGIKHGATELNNLDLVANFDTEKGGLWHGGKIKAYLLTDWGGSPAGYNGALQATSNIDSPDTVKLYEAFYEHAFFDARVTTLLGLHNYNSEFDVSEYAGAFINASFGIGQEQAQVGPSIFPTTALALRVKIRPTESSYALFGVYDGVPGDPNNKKGTHVILRKADGIYYVGELGLHSNGADSAAHLYKLGFGAWYKTTDSTDYSEQTHSSNNGFYLTADRSIYREADQLQGLGAFAQFGYANEDKNQTDYYFGGGLHYTGLIPGRNEDITGIAFARAQNSSRFRRLNDDASRAETIFELTYRAPILSWLTVQPDIQYVVNPGAAQNLDDALVLLLRVQATISQE